MNVERVKAGLAVIASNLRGPGWDNRPMSHEMCLRMADFATALATDQPFPEFDESWYASTNDRGAKS